MLKKIKGKLRLKFFYYDLVVPNFEAHFDFNRVFCFKRKLRVCCESQREVDKVFSIFPSEQSSLAFSDHIISPTQLSLVHPLLFI